MRNLIALALIAALAAPVAAAPLPEVVVEAAPTATVLVGDLDFATKTGQRTFARRLNSALETVCGSYLGAMVSVDEESRISNCRSAGTSSAHAQLAERAARLAAGHKPAQRLALAAR